MSHGVAAGSIGLEGDGPTTLRLQTNKSLEYVKINIKKELSCIVTCIELFFRKITFEISMLCYSVHIANNLPKVTNWTRWTIFITEGSMFFTKWSWLGLFSSWVIKYFGCTWSRFDMHDSIWQHL